MYVAGRGLCLKFCFRLIQRHPPLSSVHPYIFLIAKAANKSLKKLSLAICFCVRLMQKHPMQHIFASCRVLIIPLLIIPLLISLLLIIPRHPSLHPAGVSLQTFDHLFFLLLQSGDVSQVHQIQGAARNSIFANES